VAGFAVLAASPVLLAVVAFQTLQRTANFAISNPAREVLFTVVDREEKYKSKYLIDGVVFRGGDALFGWLFNLVRAAGVELAAISAATVPVAVGWLLLALTLGRAQERRAAIAPVTRG
jgi:AAA family ATP:ADP antiporter